MVDISTQVELHEVFDYLGLSKYTTVFLQQEVKTTKTSFIVIRPRNQFNSESSFSKIELPRVFLVSHKISRDDLMRRSTSLANLKQRLYSARLERRVRQAVLVKVDKFFDRKICFNLETKFLNGSDYWAR